MAIDTTDQIVQERVKHKLLQIAGATGQGGSPGQLFKPPVTNPGRGEAVYGTEKDGQRFFKFLKAMMINPNSILVPFVPKDAETDEDWGEGETPGHPGWKLAHEGQHYGKHGREIADPAKGMRPDGSLIHMKHMEQSPEEHKRNKEMHIKNYGQQANIKDSLERENVGGTLRDMMLPLLIKEYGKDGSGGYKNPSKLLSGMKKLAKNLPANNIRRPQSPQA